MNSLGPLDVNVCLNVGMLLYNGIVMVMSCTT